MYAPTQRTANAAFAGRRDRVRDSDERIYLLYLRHFKGHVPDHTRVLDAASSHGRDRSSS